MTTLASGDNPVSRLYNFLENTYQTSGGHPAWLVWCAYFSLEETNTEAVLLTVAEERRLVRLAKETLVAVPGVSDARRASMLAPFDSIETAFTRMQLQGNWNTFKENLSDRELEALKHAALTVEEILIREGTAATVASRAELQQIREQIEAFLPEILEADIDRRLKAYLVELLEAMRRAILLVDIHGQDGLEHAVKFAAGWIVVLEKDARVDTTSQKAQAFLRRVLDTARDFITVTKLVEFAHLALGSGDDTPLLPK